MKLLVTGAAGFLGQQVVLHALARGHVVLAVVRPGTHVSACAWYGKDGATAKEADLATASGRDLLQECLQDVDAVVHAAGALTGSDAEHLRTTIQPTQVLVDAMLTSGCRRLVLISSLSVYGYAALPDGCQLDETTPTEPDTQQRDAYCRAKLAQETVVLKAAQRQGLMVSVLRPGMIYGPGRWWSARLGVRIGPLALVPGGRAALPLCHVVNAATAAVLAAERDSVQSDVFVLDDPSGHRGGLEVINLIDDEQPTQMAYLRELRKQVKGSPSVHVRLPWGLMRRAASAVAVATMLVPAMQSRLPGWLRPASLHARCKPLRFSNCRLHDRLGWTQNQTWQDAIAAGVKKEA
jgi:nucleoside-diphosphate-sugar epimerase